MTQTLEKRSKKATRRGVYRPRLGETVRRLGRGGPPVWFDRLATVAVLLIAAVFTGANMFRFPQYELDEGTYVGSAWAMFEQGKLYFYTYAYDHTLLGWFQVGAFAELVGGFLRFGTSVNTGRVLMLVSQPSWCTSSCAAPLGTSRPASSGRWSSPSRPWASPCTGRCGWTTSPRCGCWSPCTP